MGKVIRLDPSDNQSVLDELNERIGDIKELCVVYITNDGTRRIIHGAIEDTLSWYGIVTGLAHNIFLHNYGDPLKD